jgi:hypothetical protein
MTKRAIWVLENVDKNPAFYSSVNTLMLMSSVINWKRWNNTATVLYVDKLTHNHLRDLDLLSHWDHVNVTLLEQPTTIDKVAFWSSSKLRVLLQQEEPVIMVDYDFITFTNLTDPSPASNFVYSHDEDGDFAYPGAADQFIKSCKWSIPDYLKWSINNDAINVSYLCFNDINFQKEYATHSLNSMEELSSLKAPKGNYVCFAEQKILKQLALHKEIEHTPLIKNRFHAVKGVWHEDQFIETGLWSKDEMHTKFIHYGQTKHAIQKDGIEFRFLCNSVKSKINSTTLDRIIAIQ